jgi:hypothetical protein
MANLLRLLSGIAGYDFGKAHELPERLKHSKLFRSLSWRLAIKILRDTFVISSGRQYAQLCDMVVAARLIMERHIKFDRTIFDQPEAFKALEAWNLPPSHTARPIHTPGLVEGAHKFWWLMLRDAFAWVFDPLAELLPNEKAIIERFGECGVGRGTSSTTTEELAGLNLAIDDLREAKGESSDQLATRSLKWHLQAELHWLTHKRPRSDRGDAHESRWRSAMVAAAATPAMKRTVVDDVLLLQVEALDKMLGMSPEELTANGLDSTRELYEDVLDRYNTVHKTQLATLHRA